MPVRVFDAAIDDDFRVASIGELSPRNLFGVTWIDVLSPSREDIHTLGKQFEFHALAIEDAFKRRQRPKLDVYDNHLFAVIYALDPTTDPGHPQAHEVTLFITENTVVTIRTTDIPELDVAEHRWAEHRPNRATRSTGMLVYTICDSIVDGYFPCMDVIAEDTDALENRMFGSSNEETLQLIFDLKRNLLDLRRVVSPARDVFNAFTRRELPILGDESVVFFQDVYDHVIRVTDGIDAARDVLSSAIDVHLSIVSNRMNQTVRTLTAASIILMSLALVAGIYGMNFELTPSGNSGYGFWFALGVMGVIGAGLAIMFRRIKWF